MWSCALRPLRGAFRPPIILVKVRIAVWRDLVSAVGQPARLDFTSVRIGNSSVLEDCVYPLVHIFALIFVHVGAVEHSGVAQDGLGQVISVAEGSVFMDVYIAVPSVSDSFVVCSHKREKLFNRGSVFFIDLEHAFDGLHELPMVSFWFQGFDVCFYHFFPHFRNSPVVVLIQIGVQASAESRDSDGEDVTLGRVVWRFQDAEWLGLAEHWRQSGFVAFLEEHFTVARLSVVD